MASRLGDRLRALRDEKALSNARLAAAAGIDESTMGAIIAGDIERPPDARLRGLAKLLDVSFESLLALVPSARRNEDAAAARSICALDLSAAGGGPPDWIELMAAGRVAPTDGREPWLNDRPDDVIAATRGLTIEPVVDFDHQTDYAAKTGQAAPAAGWIKELQVRAGAIWGRVEWTERGRAALAGKEYRYLSPVFEHAREGRRVLRILRAALTNNPALTLTALARKDSEMDELKRLAGLLGLDETADETAIAAAIAALKTAGASLKAIAKAAGLEPDADRKAIETAVASAVAKAKGGAAPDPAAYVPRSEFDQVATSLAALQKDSADGRAAKAADEAIAEGKITPAQRGWAVAYAAKDPDGFHDFVEKGPVIVKPGARQARTPARADGPLSEAELAVCRATGVDPEAFMKQRIALAAGEPAFAGESD